MPLQFDLVPAIQLAQVHIDPCRWINPRKWVMNLPLTYARSHYPQPISFSFHLSPCPVPPSALSSPASAGLPTSTDTCGITLAFLLVTGYSHFQKALYACFAAACANRTCILLVLACIMIGPKIMLKYSSVLILIFATTSCKLN